MAPAKLNYNIHDKELLAIMFTLDEWHAYLLHATELFEIWTDHWNLSYFHQPQKLNSWQACWYARLQEYDYELKHIPGASNSKADILLRLPWYKNAMPPNNNVTVLPEKHFAKKVSIEMVLFEDEQFLGEGAPPISCKMTGVALQSSVDEHIKACKQKDSQVERLEKEQPHLFSSDNGLLLYEGRIYIPPDPKLREEILHDNHDAPMAGEFKLTPLGMSFKHVKTNVHRLAARAAVESRIHCHYHGPSHHKCPRISHPFRCPWTPRCSTST